jgi:hypothetical protein
MRARLVVRSRVQGCAVWCNEAWPDARPLIFGVILVVGRREVLRRIMAETIRNVPMRVFAECGASNRIWGRVLPVGRIDMLYSVATRYFFLDYEEEKSYSYLCRQVARRKRGDIFMLRSEKVMFSKNNLFVPAVLFFTGFLGAPVANAQVQQCYTVASLQGSFAIVGNYGANVAIALGTRSYDGNGNLTGTFIVNEPTAGSTTGARTIVTGTQAGTYTVNCNGTGQFNRILTTNGVSTAQVDDFVITAAIIQNGQLVATAIADASEVPSTIVAGGIFLTRTQTRLPIYY